MAKNAPRDPGYRFTHSGRTLSAEDRRFLLEAAAVESHHPVGDGTVLRLLQREAERIAGVDAAAPTPPRRRRRPPG